ncbi:MAG: hypothetical protein JRJ38_17975 [Deltaproteobacteria bacterium]|nr:hypothetical protein [Deltaproteobacteria bacterium]
MEYNIEGKKIKVIIAKSTTLADNHYYAGIFDEHLEPINRVFRAFNTPKEAERWLKESFEALFPKHRHIYRGP